MAAGAGTRLPDCEISPSLRIVPASGEPDMLLEGGMNARPEPRIVPDQ